MEQLPRETRQIFMDRYFQFQSIKEIAKARQQSEDGSHEDTKRAEGQVGNGRAGAMNGDRLTRLIGKVDDRFVEESMEVGRRKRRRWKWTGGFVMAAALMLLVFTWDGWRKTIPLSENSSNMSVAYVGQSDIRVHDAQPNLVSMTEEQLFTQWEPALIRNVVKQIAHLELDFGRQEEYRSLVTIDVMDVYRGDIEPGSAIQVLTAAGVGLEVFQSDADVVSELRLGMEGIFMPIRYDASHIWAQNGATLQLTDVSD
ncbi:hypothetical protein [Exiguobacterium sp. s142]|uniref:hypothetical protein n=1 Tax=Exiguobacterium sp. s142 TaxID=2751222 RepID=UPI001BE4F464|nr:hypothetical protein [Exiguobacterium sp. s142]